MLGLSAPGEQVLGCHSVPTGHLGYDRTRSCGLFENAGLLVGGPATAPCLTRDHLDAANGPWRLKHMVKHQLKMIQTEDRQTRSFAAATEGGLQTPLTLDLTGLGVKFSALEPGGLIDHKPRGVSSKLNDTHGATLGAVTEQRSIPVVHGIIRWRLVDLIQWV